MSIDKKINPYNLLKKVRENKPLIHHITNFVTIYDCANIVKVFGGSPVMAHAKEEAGDMTTIASALVLNIGTLTSDIIESMKLSAKAANKKGIPIIFDVCGAGATSFRDKSCFDIIENNKIDIIKGNASEIAKIAGENVQTKGVDSTQIDSDLKLVSQKLASKYDSTVVITGETDIISDKNETLFVKNGNKMMAEIVGTGCMAASVIATFASIEKDLKVATVSGLVCFEIASEIAAEKSKNLGVGSFKVNLFDAVYNLDEKSIKEKMRIAL
ncbi:MAG: hydroxyethylthiazole kinase [Elusimicrobiota bacterium]|jgi:hydroxyethylthiazole kinase|nr:hydroxyethylthiazole kinase [Elusimicrobiota bacterium]